jgi:hypothetical protein
MMTFLDCPAYLDKQGTATCGLPAEIRYHYVTESTDGPLVSVMIRCPAGHWFNGPIEFLTPHTHPLTGTEIEHSVNGPSRGRAA